MAQLIGIVATHLDFRHLWPLFVGPRRTIPAFRRTITLFAIFGIYDHLARLAAKRPVSDIKW